MASKKGGSPPAHLLPATAKWFRAVLKDFDLEPHHVRLLTLAGEAWDRGQQAREVIEKDGMTFADRFGQPKPRPEIAIERDSRIGFARLLRELALDIDGPGESRPPRTADYGSRA
jgi:phage terminase small subunit